MRPDPLIFVSAGEASGDHYGAELIAEFKAVVPAARFIGLGGTAMEAAGQQRVVRAEDVAVMGITEILRHIPRIVASYRKLVRSIRQQRPDVAVLIDFPDVNFRLAKHLKRMGVPVIWFVSPQLWAWKRRRLRWVQQRVSKMLVIFPFEQPFYATHDVSAEFVGHPLAAASLPSIRREEYALQATQLTQQQWAYFGGTPEFIKDGAETRGYPLDPAKPYRYSLDVRKPWVALLPGSRLSEIHAHLQTLVEMAAALDASGEYEFLVPIASSAEKDLESIQQATGEYYLQSHPPRITFVRDARAALLHSRAAVVASGTATVQAAVIGTPFVAVYRVSKLTFAAAKRLVRYPVEIPAEKDAQGNLPIAMVNLIAGRRIVPELLQEQFTAENVVAHLKPLLDDTPERAVQIAALADVRRKLQSPTGQTAIERLRDAVLTALDAPPVAVYAAAPSASND